MNIVDARSYLVWVFVRTESFKQLHARTCRLHGDNISVQCSNRWEDVLKLAIAHMRVNLRFVLDTAGRQFKRLDGPIQIGWPVRATQRQSFTQSRFVYLNNPYTSGFE